MKWLRDIFKGRKSKQTNWVICPACSGQGKVLREPSRRRRLLYQEQLESFEREGKKGKPPEALRKHMDVCLPCNGSGLQEAKEPVRVDSTTYPTLAIVGGGIGGVALAVACSHRGIPFTLYERDESFNARSQGYGLTLQQASKAIHGLGILSLEDGITSTRHVVHNPSGTVIGEWGMRKWKKDPVEGSSKRKNVHVPRQTLRSSLLERVPDPDSIQWGATLVDIKKNSAGKLDIVFNVKGKEVITSADLVVGADGIRSMVRTLALGKQDTPLQYLGCIVILGICSLESVKETNSSLFDSATVFQTVNGHERIYAMPYDTHSVMWQMSFPLSESEAKELSAKGSLAMKEEVMRRLGSWHDPIPQLLAATDSSRITGYPVYDRKILDPLLLRDAGNVTLIGDAAHPMSPFKGQGANQALLDALALARALSINCGPGSRWREAGLRKTILNTFEEEMIERTTSKVRDSARAVQLLHSEAVLHEGDEPRGRGINVGM